MKLHLDADTYAKPVMYELARKERDLSTPELRQLGGTLMTTVETVDHRTYYDPSEEGERPLVLLQLSGGWTFVPAMTELQYLWWVLGTDETKWKGTQLTLTLEPGVNTFGHHPKGARKWRLRTLVEFCRLARFEVR